MSRAMRSQMATTSPYSLGKKASPPVTPARRRSTFGFRSLSAASKMPMVYTRAVDCPASGAGAVLGLALAMVIVVWLAHQGAIALPLLSTWQIDGAALGWTVLIAGSAAVIFGLLPGLKISGGNLQESLKDSG